MTSVAITIWPIRERKAGMDQAQSQARAVRSDAARDPDLDLVRRVGQGDDRAARELTTRYLDRIHAVAIRMLGDRTEAEDVSQDVFVRIWRHAAGWEPRGAKFSTWVHRVTVNLCYDRLRRRREIVTDEPPEQVDETASAFDALHAGDVGRRVAAAVAGLPPRQRAAVTLCHFEDMTNIDAAAALEVSIEALESLLSRGRRNLRTALGSEASGMMERADGVRG